MFEHLSKDWYKTTDPRQLAEHVIEHDTWDADDWDTVVPKIGSLQRALERLKDKHPTAGEALLADTFFCFDKANPKLRPVDQVRPRSQPNHQIVAEAKDLPEWHRLHAQTRSNPWYAGMAASTVVPTLLDLIDRCAPLQEQADQLDETMTQLADVNLDAEKLQALIDSIEDGVEPDPSIEAALAATTATAAQLAATAEAQGAKLDAQMTTVSLDVSAAMQEALGKAADEIGEAQQAAAAWGIDPGTLATMSADEHIALAEQLNPNDLRELAKLWGAMRPDVIVGRETKLHFTPTEVVAVTQGRNLSRALPSELVLMKHEATLPLFLAKLAEGKILQYELRGVEKQAEGGIILLEDGSGSMQGINERFAKATGLHCMNIAEHDGRPFIGIMFGGPGVCKVFRFDKPEDFTLERKIAWATTFLNDSGTDFTTPIDQALAILQEEFDDTGAVSGDIVMVTDGGANVEPDWLEGYRSERKRLGFNTWGIQIGSNYGCSGLGDVTNKPVMNIKDLFSAKDTRPLYSGV